MKKVARKLGVLYRSFKLLKSFRELKRDVYESLMVVVVYREPTGDMSPILAKYGLSTCKTRHAFYLGSPAHRGFYSLAPSEICFRFKKADISSTYGTRLSASGVILSRPHTEALRRTFFYRAQCFWNLLPSSLRTISNRV